VDGGNSVDAFSKCRLKNGSERDTRAIAGTVLRAGRRTNRNWAAGSSQVNEVLKVRLPRPCRWTFVCFCVLVCVVDVDVGF
jgi:hypothetical protein